MGWSTLGRWGYDAMRVEVGVFTRGVRAIRRFAPHQQQTIAPLFRAEVWRKACGMAFLGEHGRVNGVRRRIMRAISCDGGRLDGVYARWFARLTFGHLRCPSVGVALAARRPSTRFWGVWGHLRRYGALVSRFMRANSRIYAHYAR
jgi:hypothetical protein